MNEREKMLRQLSAVGFSAHDLQMYLDTHPNDTSAAKALEEYEREEGRLREEYEQRFGPLTAGCEGSRWAWIADPWPWNNGRD